MGRIRSALSSVQDCERTPVTTFIAHHQKTLSGPRPVGGGRKKLSLLSFRGSWPDGGMQPKEISDFQAAARAMHGCESMYQRAEFVRDVLEENIEWDGLVRVFKLINHSNARYCYAWSYRDGKETKFAVVLDIAPVN